MAKRHTDDKRGSTVGVRAFADPRGNGAWIVQWRADGKRVSRSFDSKAAALRVVAVKAAEKKEQGAAALAVDMAEWRRWLDFKAALGGAELAQVLEVWQKYAPRADSMTVSEAVEKYRDLRKNEGAVGDTWTHIKNGTARLVDAVGHLTLAEVTADDLRAWLATMTAKGMAPVTVVNNYKIARAFLNRAVSEGWVAECVADRVTPPKVPAEEVTVLSAADAAKLFAANKDEPVMVRLALEAFGGLRYSSAARLKADDIRWDERGIMLPGAKHKSGRRHYLEGLPANLWAWLDKWRHDPRPWAMTQRQILTAKGKAFAAAKVANPGNVLRHSFCSYHIAAHTDAAKTAVLLQHTNQVMLYKHYKGVVSAADAAAYFAIVP